MKTIQNRLLLLTLVLFVAGCATLKQQAKKGPGWYVVKPTDTLYSIAWRYNIDHLELADWNDLQEPYTINPGDQLMLLPEQEGRKQDKKRQITSTLATAPTPVKVKPLQPTYNQVIRWQWPTAGKLINRFEKKSLDRRGIDIRGETGQPVFAVADGKVVYSGTGLADYGNLIIVKHDNVYLSAYAHNKKRLVKEGQQVRRGETIAQMGQNEDNLPVLHFQIRKQGQPVDPLTYLPDI